MIVASSMKTCGRCKAEKPLVAFSKLRTSIDGHNPYCRDCRRYYAARAKKRDPNTYRNWNFKKKYGITVEQRDEMLKQQNGKCAICNTTEPNGGRDNDHFHVDHCHKTGTVRAILCGNCNRALGLMEDMPDRMEAGARYLREHAAKNKGVQ